LSSPIIQQLSVIRHICSRDAIESYVTTLRDYQDTKADVILKYTADEARNLKSYGEFPESVKISETVTFVDEGMDDDIEFDEMSDKEESEDDIDAI